MEDLRAIQKSLGTTIPVGSGRPWEPIDAPAAPASKGRGRRRGGNRGPRPGQAAPANTTRPSGQQRRRRPKSASKAG
jgi:ATP-dependent RNA helicase RhlE